MVVITLLMLCLIMRMSLCNVKNQGFIEDTVERHRYDCPDSPKLSFTVASPIQCVGRCSMEKLCRILNFVKREEDPIGNCEIFLNPMPETSCHLLDTTNSWLAMKFKRIENEDTKNEADQVHASCKEIFDSGKGSTDGVYLLKSGRHHCVMAPLGECGGGGWTLAMKVNGSEDTFESDSSYWQNDNVYKVDRGLSNPDKEAKYPAFSAIAFQSVCIGMTYDNDTRWILINKSASSLFDIFKNNEYSSTAFGADKWTSFMNESCLQPDCNMDGFNAGIDDAGTGDNDVYVRIGIASNKKNGIGNQCNKIQSYIGIGTKLKDTKGGCLKKHRGVSCGNFVMCNEGICERSVPAIGTVLIK